MFSYTLTQILYKFGIYSEGSGDQIKGIDGWLIIPLIRLIFYPIFILKDITTDIAPLTSPIIWSAITTEGSKYYSSLWAPFVIFEFISRIFLLFFAAYIFFHFIKKSSRLPGLMINLLIIGISIVLLESAMLGVIPSLSAASDAARSSSVVYNVIVNTIWIFYFLKSKRVKNTFTNTI